MEKKGEIARESMSVFGVARVRARGEKKMGAGRKGAIERSDFLRLVGGDFSCSVRHLRLFLRGLVM